MIIDVIVLIIIIISMINDLKERKIYIFPVIAGIFLCAILRISSLNVFGIIIKNFSFIIIFMMIIIFRMAISLKKYIGLGDIYMCILFICAYGFFKGFIIIFLSFFVAAIYSLIIILIARGNNKSFPFIPFMFIGFIFGKLI